MNESYIEIGATALRNPYTGGFLPAVPLYVKAEDLMLEAEERFIADIGNLFALRIKAYMDACEEAGVEV